MKKKSNNYVKYLCIGLFSVWCSSNAQAMPMNEILNEKFNVQLSLNNVTLKEVIDLLSKQTDVLFSYDKSLETKTVNNISVDVKNENITTILNQVLKGTGIKYEIKDHVVILYTSNSTKPTGTTKSNGAQQKAKKVSGVIKDKNGESIIGASIKVKGEKTGTVTGIDGDFLMQVPGNATLVVSYIGYVTQEVSVSGKNNINITLSEDVHSLNEVVVTAMGIKRQKRSIGYSTTEVGGDQLTASRDLNLGNALSGKISGVSVAGNSTGLGGSSRVIIRGNASLTGNNQPLYVIDGVPFDNTNQGNAGTWGGMDMGDGLSNINPDDIANVQVLKGAAASALYGYRGGNGAILITTKSGKKDQDGIGVEFNNNLTFNSIYDYRDFQKTYGQGTQGIRPADQTSAYQTYNSSWGEKLDGGSFINRNGESVPYRYVDNWKNFYRTGIDETASAAISGKNDKITYRFGLSNTASRANLPNAGLNQQGINMNTTYDFTKKLHLNVTANYVFEHVNGRANLSDGNGSTNATLLYLANGYDVRSLKGNNGADADGKELLPGNNVYFNNPYWLQYRKTNESDKNRLTTAGTLRYDITDWLYAQGQITRDGYILSFRQIQPIGAGADPKGYMSEYEKNYSEINLNYLIGFNKKINDFSVNATVGGNRQRNITKQYGTDGGIRPFTIGGAYSASTIAASTRTYKKTYSEYQVNSVYGTADFGYKDWLFLNFTGRNDWFSTLDPNNNSYFYPSVSLSWMLSDCFKLPEWVTTAKVRASLASASNGTSPYQTQLTYELNNFNVQGQSMGYIKNSIVPNAYLKPVKISEKEIGANASFFNNRLGFDVAVYEKNTKDDIVQVSTSQTSGFSSAYKNIGEIRNRGLEFMVFGVPVNTKDFSWNTSFNLAYNNSKVLYLGDGVNSLSIDGAQSRSGQATIRNIIGDSYGEIVGYKYKTDAKGNRVYTSAGLPVRSDDVDVLGSGVYKWTGGFHNDFSYKNFTLSFLLDFKLGAKLFSGTNYSLYGAGLQKNTLQGREGGMSVTGVDVNGNSFSKTGVNAQTYWQSVLDNNITEEFVYDASFLKLRELSFGYNFPKSFLASKVPFVKSLSISLVGRNLWTIIKHTPNIDPESAYNNSNGQGLELNGYPATRNVGFNLNVKF
ncbi:SusC/RagA family TonB-linked outer membrane protein [uncultured Bacteroides sp.]|uniref:SusC/RagA family TonB-linked outer membrane protein n=1 Tax=uncultured Bacteroides sp. TaxID=162156 RepID=UPI002AABD8DF|nr:SusC/RagA family TonB-linked outer membrane protein [uncultured Bacteroides sp.]